MHSASIKRTRDDRRFLITGGCGFIGSHLADRLLALGHRVRILDDLSTGRLVNAPTRAELLTGDVADEAAIRRAMSGMDGCFHLAAVASVARSNEEPIATNRVNLVGTLNVLRAAAEAGRLPVVYASSAAVYGANAAMPLSETADTAPLSTYGADKLACELHARVATHLHGMPTVGLRFFNVYGTRQPPSSPYSGVISIFAGRLREKKTVTIHGDGGQMRDFIYVGDVVEVLVRAMAHNRAEAAVCNVCTGRGTTIRALAERLAELSGAPLDMVCTAPRAGDIRVSVGDPRKLHELYGLVPRTPLHEGLRHVLHGLPRLDTAPPRAVDERWAAHDGGRSA